MNVLDLLFGSREALQAHERYSSAHTTVWNPPTASPSLPALPASQQVRARTCTECDQVFPTKVALADHSIITEHGIDRYCMCSQCHLLFKTKGALDEHRRHTGKHSASANRNYSANSLECKGNVYSTIPEEAMNTVSAQLSSMCHPQSILQRHHFPLEAGWRRATAEFLPTPAAHVSEPKRKVVVLDCEMSGVARGKSEVVFLTAIDCLTGDVLVQTLVRPAEPILDWRSNIHGITPGTMATARALGKVLDGFAAARAALWEHIDGDTILIGQSLNHDLACLRIVHTKVVDTAVLASEAVFGDWKKAQYHGLGLQNLCLELLGIKIREYNFDASGSSVHDSLEDVLATREVLLWILEHREDFGVWAAEKGRTQRAHTTNHQRRTTESMTTRSRMRHSSRPMEILRFRDVVGYDVLPDGMSDYSE